MGDTSEFNTAIRLFLKTYPWRRVNPTPWAKPHKPLNHAKLALISSAGFVLGSQPPFDNNMKGGDWSYREIPDETPLIALNEYHRSRSFDHKGIQQDPNLALPLDRLREMVQEKKIGSANHRHFSFMGSLTAPGRLIKKSAPEVAEHLVRDEVDVALLVPV